MNIEALTEDLNRVFQQHGIGGNLQRRMQIAFGALLTDLSREQFEHLIDGGSVFVISDDGAIFSLGPRLSKNASRLGELLHRVTPEQFGRLLEMFLEELTKASDSCQCDRCVEKRATTTGNLN